jgi:hypothetical protein
LRLAFDGEAGRSFHNLDVYLESRDAACELADGSLSV